ncbi:hypothetical protein D3C76_1597280 [compost metagenome]
MGTHPVPMLGQLRQVGRVGGSDRFDTGDGRAIHQRDLGKAPIDQLRRRLDDARIVALGQDDVAGAGTRGVEDAVKRLHVWPFEECLEVASACGRTEGCAAPQPIA